MEATSLRNNLAPESLTRSFSVEVPATRKLRAFLHSSKKQGGATSSRPFLHAPLEFGGWKPALLPFFYRGSAGPGRWGNFSRSSLLFPRFLRGEGSFPKHLRRPEVRRLQRRPLNRLPGFHILTTRNRKLTSVSEIPPAKAGNELRSRLLLLTLIFFGLLAVLILLATEFWLRHSYLGDSNEPRDHAEETWYLPVRLRGDYEGVMWDIPFATNTYGFRDEPPLDPVPPEGEFRILSLGDSIGFGLGVPSRDRYGQVLQRELNKPPGAFRFRVVNASGQGYSPSSYAAYIHREGLELNPDLVLVQIELCNDVTDEALLGWSSGVEAGLPGGVRGGRYVVGWDGQLLGTWSRGPYFFEKTYTYTLILRKILESLYRISPTEPFHSTRGLTYYAMGYEKFLLDRHRIDSGWKRLFGALEGIRDLLERERIPFLLMLVPSRFVFQQDAPVHALFARKLMDRAIEQCRSRQIPYLDLSHDLRQAGGSELYFDFAHLTSEGNRITGRVLAHELRRRYLVPGGEEPKPTPPPIRKRSIG